jgi:hypothetical protein
LTTSNSPCRAFELELALLFSSSSPKLAPKRRIQHTMSNYQPQNYMSARRKSSVLTNSQDHLWGIRAILAVQSFAWLFFKVFNPALTIPSATPTGEHIPDASPSTVPGVFGGPGIVGPGADSGIVARGLQTRDLYTRNLGMSIYPLSFCSQIIRSGRRERCGDSSGETSGKWLQLHRLSSISQCSTSLFCGVERFPLSWSFETVD